MSQSQAGPWRSGKIADAILAYPRELATPASTIVYGGDSTAFEVAFEAARSILEVFGEAAYLGADPGVASVLEAAILLPFAPHGGRFGEGARGYLDSVH